MRTGLTSGLALMRTSDFDVHHYALDIAFQALSQGKRLADQLCMRLELKFFREEFRRIGALHRSLLLNTQALLTQMSQTAVCNRLHSVEQQLCRWLLLSRDRLEADELIMTQELIANMLGVRREGVSVAAHRLQEAGLIRYRRGHITIVDRAGLERTVCECYQVVKTECDRLLTF